MSYTVWKIGCSNLLLSRSSSSWRIDSISSNIPLSRSIVLALIYSSMVEAWLALSCTGSLLLFCCG